MNKIKKSICAGLCGLVISGCGFNNLNNPKHSLDLNCPNRVVVPSLISFKLEDLCNTEVDWRNIKLNVYIEDSDVIWDYYKYKKEIFSYVKEFFKENKINCEISYFNGPFSGSCFQDEFRIEIFDSNKKMAKRYFKLFTDQEIKSEENPLILDKKGYAVTRKRTSLINGGWEEFRDLIKDGSMKKEEAESQFQIDYKGVTTKDYMFKSNASNICHEVLHCMTLFHPRTFNPFVIDSSENNIPNIMSYLPPNLKSETSLGYRLNPLQQKLMHSFIAGNNNYLAFVDSQSDLTMYLENLAIENNLNISK